MYLYPKDHGISKLLDTGDPKEPRGKQSHAPQKEGAMILSIIEVRGLPFNTASACVKIIENLIAFYKTWQIHVENRQSFC